MLKTSNKFYASDLGIKKIKTNNKEVNYSISLENVIYNELIAKGYEVYIGKTRKGEVDFVVVKDKDIKYIQVCYYLNTEETIEREFGAYNCINDNYPKYVISLDKQDFSRNGIKHVNAIDFMLKMNFSEYKKTTQMRGLFGRGGENRTPIKSFGDSYTTIVRRPYVLVPDYYTNSHMHCQQ